MEEPKFLTYDDILFIHHQEIKRSGGSSGIRNKNGIKSSVGGVMATFKGNFLMDVFEMAATYLYSIIKNHPFIDGNKRTGLASALTFLFLNGIEIKEKYDEELADIVLKLTVNEINKEDIVDFLKKRAKS